MAHTDKSYIIAIDAGGTMTDTFLVDEKGHFVVGKSLTARDEQWKSYIESVQDAASKLNLTSKDVHSMAAESIYGGTVMLNMLLMGRGLKMGLLITRGFEHTPVMERGLTWLGSSVEDVLKQRLREHTPWLVDPRLVKPVSERVGGGTYFMHHPPGTEFIPLAEAEVRKGTEELLNEGVQAIAILFIYSVYNPAHEQRAKEIVREVCTKRHVDIPVVISSEVVSLTKELPRLNSLLIQTYVATPTAEQMLKIEAAAKSDGYKYELLTVLSYGGVVNIRYPRLYESMISGPIGGLIGGKAIADLKGIKSLICCDLGGTSFDVGVITNGMIGLSKQPDFAKRRLNLPMVSIDSIGAGTGSVIHVHPDNRVTIGPDSAEAAVGTCLRYPEITIADINVVLGYLDPHNFLGGKIELNKQRALEALTERLAKPLKQDVYSAGAAVLEILHTRLREQLYTGLLVRGYDPKEYTLLAYGGAGPLHLWGASEGVPFSGIATVPWAAAFSAFGIAVSEYSHRYQKSVATAVYPARGDKGKMAGAEGLNAAWRELEQQAHKELEAEGFSPDQVRLQHGIFARYLGQMESFEAIVPVSSVTYADDMDKVIEAFEKAYATIYPAAARFPQAGYFISDVVLTAVAPRIKPVIPRHKLSGKRPSSRAYKGERDVFHRSRWIKFGLWEMDLLQAGNRVDGPSIIEHPMTTLVIPPEKCVQFDEHKIIWYGNK